MSSVPYKFTTTASTNLLQVRQQGSIKGYSAVNLSLTVPAYIKLYWFTPTAAVPTPVVGTTIPNMVIGVSWNAASPTIGTQDWPDGITGNGQLWVAVTGAPGDTDTSNAPAGVVVTLLVE